VVRTPIHVCEIPAEWTEGLGVSPTDLTPQVRVPADCISEIVEGHRANTGDAALRLAQCVAQFSRNLQVLFYDVWLAERVPAAPRGTPLHLRRH